MRINTDRERRRKKICRIDINKQCTKRYANECGNLENWKLTKEQLAYLLKLPEDRRTKYLHSIGMEGENNESDS